MRYQKIELDCGTLRMLTLIIAEKSLYWDLHGSRKQRCFPNIKSKALANFGKKKIKSPAMLQCRFKENEGEAKE